MVEPAAELAHARQRQAPGAEMILEALTEFLVSQPTAVARLLIRHVDNGHGDCRVCTIGGQHGNLPWPCTIHMAASLARDRTNGTLDQ